MSSKARTDASTPAAGMPSKGKAQEEPKGERLKVTSDADNAFASKKMHSPEKRKTTVQIDTDKLSANAKLAAALAATAPKRKVVPPPAPTPAPAPTAVDTGTGTSPEKATAKPASPGANPLDALAFACLAEEQMRDSTTFTAESEEVEEGGIQVRVNEIRCTDVLCGRGGQSNHHAGNIFFRRLVRAKQEEYLKANKREKTMVAKDIVSIIRKLAPPGRFLKKHPKNEAMYVDVGDVQARNKASQALREGAPELREELRDQYSKMGPAGSEMRLPYHGSGKSASSDNSKDSEEEYQEISKSGRDNLKAAAAAQGIMFPPYGRNARDGGAEAYFRQAAAGRGDGADGSAAAFHSAAAEERARRLMLAAAGAPGGAAAYLNPHFGLGGLGGLGGAGPSLHHFQGGNVAHLHAMSSAASHLLSPHALMLAGLSPQQQSSAAALLQASRSRELASQFGGGGGSSINPYLLSHHQQGQSQPPQLHDTSRLHEFVGSNGNKRPRKDPECDIPEEKAARLSRQYL